VEQRRIINGQRERRAFRVRNRVRGTAERPRMCVNRSLKNLSVQLIDDASGKTLVSATTLDKALRSDFKTGGNCDAASKLGKIVAEKALAAGVKQVAFDRGRCRYHGRVAALADAARAAGLEF
jgi:large subunit ribosomal protein L18